MTAAGRWSQRERNTDTRPARRPPAQPHTQRSRVDWLATARQQQEGERRRVLPALADGAAVTPRCRRRRRAANTPRRATQRRPRRDAAARRERPRRFWRRSRQMSTSRRSEREQHSYDRHLQPPSATGDAAVWSRRRALREPQTPQTPQQQQPHTLPMENTKQQQERQRYENKLEQHCVRAARAVGFFRRIRHPSRHRSLEISTPVLMCAFVSVCR